ncbi:hypothetical protein GCM10009117_21210 [Gangjinia marincola]|uniref:Uncharacterized protein n=1 Tax=Gangjinia marincola TaxID=578463 RepID=A0ABP3XUB0_9FLAO
MNINGDVESIKFNQFQAVKRNGQITKEPLPKLDYIAYVDNEYYFNKKGMIDNHIQYTSNRMTHKYVYEYDKNLCTISKKYYDYSGELVNESYFKNVLNEEGELVEEKEYMTGKNVDRNVILSNFVDKNKVEEIDYVGDMILRKQKYKYNANNNVIEEINLSEGDQISFKVKHLYNYNRNIVKTVTVDEKGDTISIENYKYLKFDDEGNWTKMLITGSDSTEILVESKIVYRK